MRCLVEGRLWIGNAGDLRRVREVLDAGIRAVVELAWEEPPPALLPRDLIVCRFPLLDGTGNSEDMLRLAVGCVQRLLESNLPTLVACGSGMSRSPAVAAIALARWQGRPAEAVLEEIVSTGPHDVAGDLWADLIALDHAGG